MSSYEFQIARCNYDIVDHILLCANLKKFIIDYPIYVIIIITMQYQFVLSLI